MSDPIQHPDLRLLYDYWLSKRHGRLMPSRADIDPTELPGRIWPCLTLLDTVRDGKRLRFRYRLTGEHFLRAIGGNPIGEYLDTVLPLKGGYRDYVIEIYSAVVNERAAYYTENTYTLAGQAVPMLTRRMSLPLSDDGDFVNITLSGHVFEYPTGEHSYMVKGISGFAEITRHRLAG